MTAFRSNCAAGSPVTITLRADQPAGHGTFRSSAATIWTSRTDISTPAGIGAATPGVMERTAAAVQTPSLTTKVMRWLETHIGRASGGIFPVLHPEHS